MPPEVFEAEISAERAGPWARPVLTALAYACGDGMPATVLRRVTAVFSATGEPTRQQLHDALRLARFCIQTSADTDGTTLYRLFHQALADHLHVDDTDTSGRILDRILSTLPSGPDGSRQWHLAACEPYLLRHAIQHAADAGRIDELLADSEFLVYADPAWLRLQLDDAVGDRALRAVAVYRTSMDKHHSATSEARRQILAADAARHGNSQLRRRLASPAGLPGLAWQPTWATGSQVSELLRDVLTGPTKGTTRVACVLVGDHPVAVAVSGNEYNAEDKTGVVAVWDLVTGQLRYPPLTGHTEAVTAVACTQVNGRPVGVTGSIDRTVRIWDLATGQPCGPPLTGHTGTVFAIACTELDGLPVALTGSGNRDDALRIWDLAACQPLAPGFGRASAGIGGLACSVVGGHPVAVAVNWEGILRMWDVTTRRLLARVDMNPGKDASFSVACTELDGRPVAVTGSGDGTVRAWWLDQRKPGSAGPPIVTQDDYHFTSVTCAQLEDRPIVLAGSAVRGDRSIRAWDLSTRAELDIPLTGSQDIVQLASTHLRGRPLLVASDRDGSVRAWYLEKRRSNRKPITGHSDSSWVGAIACTEHGSRAIAVTGGAGDGTVRGWDIRRGHPYGPPMTGRGSHVGTAALTTLRGQPIAVTSCSNGNLAYGSLQEWDLETCAPIGEPFGIQDRSGEFGEGNYYPALACTQLKDKPVAITGDRYGSLRTWDLETREPTGKPLTSDSTWIKGIACTLLDDQPVAISVGGNLDAGFDVVEVWDLTHHLELGPPLTLPHGRVSTLACSRIAGRPIVIFGCHDGSVWTWDLLTRRRRLPGLGTHPGTVTAITCTDIDGQPTAIIGSYRGPVRIWDLASTNCRYLHTPDAVHSLAASDAVLVVGSGCEIITYKHRKLPLR